MEAAKAAAQGVHAPLAKTTLLGARVHCLSMPAPCPSYLAQFVAPADHALVYAAVAVDALAIQLRSHEAQPYELRRAFLAFLFGCKHTAPAYNHIHSGGEHNE